MTETGVIESNPVLLAVGQANKLKDELLGQRITTLESKQTKKMVGSCPKEPSSPS